RISVSQMGSDFFERLSSWECAEIYAQTLANGGEHMDRYRQVGPYFEQSDGSIKGQKGGQDIIIFIKTVATPSGDKRMLILKTNVIPVDSTVETLKIQLWCLTVVMLLLSLLMALP